MRTSKLAARRMPLRAFPGGRGRQAGVSSPSPAAGEARPAWARSCGRRAACGRARPGTASTARTSTRSRPRIAAAARPSASSAASTAPFHATSAPPSASSGAAYSHSTGSAASARAVTRSKAPSPSTPPRARGRPRRSRARPGLHRALEVAAVPERSRRGHLRVRQRRGEGEPGQPAPEPRSAIAGAAAPRRARAPTASRRRARSTASAGVADRGRRGRVPPLQRRACGAAAARPEGVRASATAASRNSRETPAAPGRIL